MLMVTWSTLHVAGCVTCKVLLFCHQLHPCPARSILTRGTLDARSRACQLDNACSFFGSADLISPRATPAVISTATVRAGRFSPKLPYPENTQASRHRSRNVGGDLYLQQVIFSKPSHANDGAGREI